MKSYLPINLVEKLSMFSDLWAPKVIGEMNDYQLKLVKFCGEFVWHDHKETDEVFFVLSGNMQIEFRDGSVQLAPGELFIVPKGAEHRTRADSECHALIIEPRNITNTGDAGGALTADKDVWI